MKKGLLIVISGPSGAGKGTVANKVIEQTGIKPSVSVTTRPVRCENGVPIETEGVHYYFRTVEQYRQMIAAGEFLETAEVYSNMYGTPKKPVFESLENGKDILLEVDIHGAKSIKKQYPDAVLIFLMTPDFGVLEQRLRGRGTESKSALETRLKAAKHELSKYEMFDYIVFNDTVEQATDRIIDIIDAEKCRIKNNETLIKELLSK